MKVVSKLSFIAFGLSLGWQAQASSQFETNLYVENTAPILLHTVEKQADGRDLLVSKLTLPIDSTLSFYIPDLARQLELQVLSPEQVNFDYLNNSSQLTRSTEGFVCGVKILDIPDDDLRGDEAIMETSYCLSNRFWDRLQSVEGDSEESKVALLRFLKNKDHRDLVDLSRKVQDEMMNQMATMMATKAPSFGSPLANCGKGCLKGRMRSGFGMRVHPTMKVRKMHKGIDFSAKTNTAVLAALPGKVLQNKTQRTKGKKGNLTGYGHYVIMSHDGNLKTVYAHLSSFKAKPGASVAQGAVIAASGNTGTSSGPHLHFEVQTGSKAVNPLNYIKHLVHFGWDLLKELGLAWA